MLPVCTGGPIQNIATTLNLLTEEYCKQRLQESLTLSLTSCNTFRHGRCQFGSGLFLVIIPESDIFIFNEENYLMLQAHDCITMTAPI